MRRGRRSRFGWMLPTAVLCLMLGVLAAAAGQKADESRRPPNVVLIISDDQGWTDYSFMGHPQIRTPNLDRLAAQSLVFRRGYVPASLCCPSLASMITGRYPHQHKITSNDPPLPPGVTRNTPAGRAAFEAGRETMNRHLEAVPTLPRMLAARGYVSLQTGKWWQGDYRRGGFTQGMTRGQRHGDEGLAIGRETMQPVSDFIDGAKRDDMPFFVWYAPMLPHTPHDPPERLLAKYRDRTPSLPIAKYRAMCEWFDESCGQLLEILERKGVAKDTLVLYVTDNGWIQDPQASRFAPRSKQSPYDGGIRTPVMVRWPGRVSPREADRLALSLDLAPTILAAAGAEVPRDLPGLNLLDDGALRNRNAVFGECFTHDAVDLDRPAANLRWRWVVDGDWKLILPAPQNEPDGKPELYRITRDPHEETNLAGQEPETVQRLTRQLDEWWPGSSSR